MKKHISKKNIKSLLKDREAYLNIAGPNAYSDAIEKGIIKNFKAHSDKYPVDFIIETYTHFGDSPSILYDDNGLFAVVSEGVQTVVSGNEKIDGVMNFFPKKKQWKKTIREAVKYYIKH